MSSDESLTHLHTVCSAVWWTRWTSQGWSWTKLSENSRHTFESKGKLKRSSASSRLSGENSEPLNLQSTMSPCGGSDYFFFHQPTVLHLQPRSGTPVPKPRHHLHSGLRHHPPQHGHVQPQREAWAQDETGGLCEEPQRWADVSNTDTFFNLVFGKRFFQRCCELCPKYQVFY